MGITDDPVQKFRCRPEFNRVKPAFFQINNRPARRFMQFQPLIQIISILGTALYTGIGTIIVVFVTKLITGGLRVDEEDEVKGLDSSLHGERAFEIE